MSMFPPTPITMSWYPGRTVRSYCTQNPYTSTSWLWSSTSFVAFAPSASTKHSIPPLPNFFRTVSAPSLYTAYTLFPSRSRDMSPNLSFTSFTALASATYPGTVMSFRSVTSHPDALPSIGVPDKSVYFPVNATFFNARSHAFMLGNRFPSLEPLCSSAIPVGSGSNVTVLSLTGSPFPGFSISVRFSSSVRKRWFSSSSTFSDKTPIGNIYFFPLCSFSISFTAYLFIISPCFLTIFL